MQHKKSIRSRAVKLTLAMVLAGGGLAATATSGAQAAENPYQRGPAPTESSIESARGSYSVSEDSVSSLRVRGFGGGDIYYPSSTSDGKFGAVVIIPGFTASKSSMAWLAPRLASQGFVVFNIDTNSTLDQPASRGDQLLAALDYLTEDSSVANRIDSSRAAVVGHSMGGGGTLEAAKERPSLKAAIPLTGWNTDKSWSEIKTPTLVVGAENDSVASVSSHSKPFYNSMPSSLDKAYLELDGASHFAPNSTNVTISKYSVSWLKRFVDDDTRYEQFLCPTPDDRTISDYQDTCPHS